jgi:HlyD family secretion protein
MPPADAAPRSGKSPRKAHVAVGTGVGAVIALAGFGWFWIQPAPPPLDRIGPAAAAPQRLNSSALAPAGQQAITVAPVATATTLTLIGTIGPGKTVAALAPFDGVIRERRAQLGARVGVGEVLVTMDTGDIETRLREAQAAFLKSSMAIDLLDRWSTSPDVTRARRTQETAEASLAVIERQVTETKKLLDRGIVSRNEYDGLVQQRDSQRNTATGSRLDLQTTLERGSADNRRLADLELQNAKSRLADLQAQADGAIVRAPVEGIVTRPPLPAQGTQSPPAIDAGSRVTRGQAIYSVADTATLVVTGKADEIDINRLRVGQPVLIGGDAFPGDPIPGQIIAISAEADVGQSSGRAPAFEVRAAFPGNTGPARDRIRIGMSARMQIELASNPKAIVVPIDAVRDPMTDPSVQVRDPRDGSVRSRKVTLGATHEQGIEILSGLEAGDSIVRP